MKILLAEDDNANGRYGGEEFLAALSYCDNLSHCDNNVATCSIE